MRSVKVTALMIMLSGVVISAQNAVATATREVRQGTKSVIHGKVVDASASPQPNVTVRLRNMTQNRVEQKSVSDRKGEFTFAAQPEVPYVVEVVDQAGRVLAVGDATVVRFGEVASALVTLPSNLPSAAGILGNTAGSVIAAATGIGITTFQLAAAAQSPAATPVVATPAASQFAAPPASPEQ
jgi:Carboxypeptidase regulatory-like domain